jgi:nucleotide-binding universal stress UspA family protein
MKFEEHIMYRSIVVAVDIARIDKAERILRRARALIDSGGRITLVNVVEELPTYLSIDLPTDLLTQARTDGEARLRDLRDRLQADAAIDMRIGSPAHEILASAAANQADLIIIASHMPDFSNYLLGATADRVVRHAKCSVLVDR